MKIVWCSLVLLLTGCGPGASDFVAPIINGYEYSDAGYYERVILYTDNQPSTHIVIDARVDNFIVKGTDIFVARRPREIRYSDQGLTSILSEGCEYWIIDTVNHVVQGPLERIGDKGKNEVNSSPRLSDNDLKKLICE